MIFPSNRVRIFVATDPVDFRKGHNGLAALVQNHFHKDPFTGTVYVFRSKRADRLKLLYWEGSGLVWLINGWKITCSNGLRFPTA
jgi:transposase